MSLPKTHTHTYYTIGIVGQTGTFGREGYSKYNDRWQDKSIMPWDVYGYEQAVDHIKELRENYKTEVFFINVETVVTTQIEIHP